MTSNNAMLIHLRRDTTYLFEDIWVKISFLLTFAKLLFLPIGLNQLMTSSPYLIYTITLLIILDIVDGKSLLLNKKTVPKRVKVNRQICDAIIDRVLMHSFVLVAMYEYQLSAYYYFIFLARELLLGYIVFNFYRKRGSFIKPIWQSKITNIILGFMVSCVTLINCFHISFIIPLVFFAIYSLYRYNHHPSFID